MGKRKENKVYLEFIGNNANGVTGSCIYGKFYDEYLERDYQFLLELGMKQDGSPKEQYETNMRMLENINFKEIDAIFSCDSHADHSLLIPHAVSKGFNGIIYGTKEKEFILPDMWNDGIHINKDMVKLLISKGVKAKPYYTDKHVLRTQGKFERIELEKLQQITPNISFIMLPTRHNLGSSSIVLFFKDNNKNIHKLFYSSDLGNVKFDKSFINQKQEPITHANVCIYESTYSARDRMVIDKKLRNKELYELKETIKNTLINKKGTVLMPAFSFDRTPNLLLVLIRDIIEKDEELKSLSPKILVTGKLTNKLLDTYELICDGKNKEDIDFIKTYKNLRRLREFKEVQSSLSDKTPKIILASSGFCTNGHVVWYLERLLGKKENTIIFSGYSSPDSPATAIKTAYQTGNLNIKLGKSIVTMHCDVLELYSFSSHIMRDDLIKYITHTNMDKCVLVHGDAREELAEDLEIEFSKLNKTTKVLVPKIGQSLLF